jgi:hypothetical protein
VPCSGANLRFRATCLCFINESGGNGGTWRCRSSAAWRRVGCPWTGHDRGSSWDVALPVERAPQERARLPWTVYARVPAGTLPVERRVPGSGMPVDRRLRDRASTAGTCKRVLSATPRIRNAGQCGPVRMTLLVPMPAATCGRSSPHSMTTSWRRCGSMTSRRGSISCADRALGELRERVLVELAAGHRVRLV